MPRISSRMTFFYKRVFPIFWFGFLSIFVAVGLFVTANSRNPPPVAFRIVPVLMIAFGYFIMRKLVFDLVDEVRDAGDALIVRSGGREERIALSDIMNVNYAPLINPPRVTCRCAGRAPSARR